MSPCDDKFAPNGEDDKMANLVMENGKCIFVDKTEVTVGDYKSFLATSPPSSTQAALCEKNDSFVPEVTCLAPTVWDTALDAYPVVCVDQCDALAYCAWKGKDLCHGVPGHTTDTDNAWYQACSDSGAHPNMGADGPTNSQTCNGLAKNQGAALPVGVQSACKTARGLYDMSGNVAEWTAVCDTTTGATDHCEVRGGSFVNGMAEIQCTSSFSPMRNFVSKQIGFRCCYEP